MAKTNTKNTSTQPENQDDLSEQQKEVLSQTEHVAESDIETVIDPAGEVTVTVERSAAFVELHEGYAETTVDENDLITAVEEGRITGEEFTEICGVEYVGRTEPATEPRDYLYSTETLCEHFTDRFTKGLNAAGAVLVMTGMVQRNEISAEIQAEVTTWLKSLNDPSINGTTSNNPQLVEIGKEITESIKRAYRPAYETLEAATKVASEIISDKIRSDAEFEGTRVATLVIALTDIAYRLIESGELAVSYREVPATRADGSKGLARFCRMHADFWNKIKSAELLGKVQREVTKIGNREREEGKLFDPYNDRSISPLVKLATMKACLLAYSHVTEVVFGYVAKKASPSGRMHRNMIVLREVPEGTEQDYYKVAAIAHNVLVPKMWGIYPIQKRVISDTKDGPTEKLVTFTELRADMDNTDNTLRWMPDEAVEPAYQHFFANHTLVYHTSERGDKKVPTGSIIDSHDPNFPPVIRQREAGTTAVDDVTKLREELSAQKAATLAAETRATKAEMGLDHEDIIRSLQAIAGRVKNAKLPASDTLLANVLEPFFALLSRCDEKLPGNDVLKLLVKAEKSIDQVIEWNADLGEWFALGPNGIRKKIETNGAGRQQAA